MRTKALLSFVTSLLLSCHTEESPKATAACTKAIGDDACGVCCAANGTNAHEVADRGKCICNLRAWIFLQ
jgi:hypothetical protein